MKEFATQNVYLAAFLVSQDNFTLGKIYIAEKDKQVNKVTIAIIYDEKYQTILDSLIDLYNKKRAICRISVYQDNIRFIMQIVNIRKSGIPDTYSIGMK